MFCFKEQRKVVGKANKTMFFSIILFLYVNLKRTLLLESLSLSLTSRNFQSRCKFLVAQL